ncbi:leucine-rich repeat domain-containing protein [Pseudomonas sp. NBRC 111130]|uniref:leucine-rich repeat domain-containing protein n=1 Tax=Pseudomonas sp. NBRC 111130 TaxID=1661045 RepID=UPI0006D3FED4|nr:leucine-rich repeat domain-containing protein [Pseudomonas sp. NBRC 111130]
MANLTDAVPHAELISAQLPLWARHITPQHWQAMRRSQRVEAFDQDWYNNAAPDLRESVTASHARLQSAQAALASSLKGLKQISEFAEPLLQTRLAEAGFTASLHGSELLRVERTWTWSVSGYLYSHRRDPLLQAALQNFADDETFTRESAIALSDKIHVTRITVDGRAPTGPQTPPGHFLLASERYEVERLALTPEAFAQLCRELDLGGAYQAHLQQCFAAPQAREQAIAVRRDRLRLAADVAYLRHALSGATRDQVDKLLQGGDVPCWQLALFGIVLHEVMLIDAGSSGWLLYLPDDSPALHLCTDVDAIHQLLVELLKAPENRQRLHPYLSQADQPRMLDLLQQNLDETRAADLHPTLQAINGKPFDFYQDQHLARLKSAAEQIAVPTAVADAQARAKRIAAWESLGLDVLNLAAFFIPSVGTVMLAVTACQLLGEVYEGYEAWHEGDRHQALQHLEAVGLNLAVIGGLATAGRVVPKLFSSPLLESLQEVRCSDGRDRLWQPDLLPYRSPQVLPEGLPANAQGQYLQGDRHYIRMDGQLYEQRFDPHIQQWRIVHPEAADAYQPPLEHNGQGAWRAAHEQPQAWPFTVLARRLGEDYAAFTPAQLELAGQICGVDAARLRLVHLEGRPAPALMLDTLGRMSGEPLELIQNEAEPLLQRHREWPLVRALEGLLVHQQGTTDSERLLLSCLDDMPQWPADLRLELRAGSPQGPLLDSSGSSLAGTVCRVIKSARGYEADLGERPAPAPQDQDLCRAVEQALPGAWRKALGISTTDGNTLRQRVVAWTEPRRTELLQRLWGAGARRQSARTGLRGGRRTLPSGPYLQVPLASRYRRLYPASTDEEFLSAMDDWQQQGRSPAAEMRNLEQRLEALRRDLGEWARPDPHYPHRRQQAVTPIINAWRRISRLRLGQDAMVYSLDLARLDLEDRDLASLALPDDFTHIEHVSLQGNRNLSLLPAEFYERFPRLKRLLLSHCRFARLPRLANPQALAWLDLDNNRITWDDSAQQMFDQFTNLGVLDMGGNPLLRAPDLSRMPRLFTLFLDNCALTELPRGLESITITPVTLDLAGNQLQQLPANFRVSQPVAQAMRLESQWLSSRMLEEVEAYNAAHQVDLLVDESDYDEFFRGAGPHEEALWQRLPLQYRRDLRSLLDLEPFTSRPRRARTEFWRRLTAIDHNPQLREHALARPAHELFDIAL